MADNRRGKDQRFYFSRGQLVLLGAAFALASAVIFFLGVFVGKGIEERRIVKNEEPAMKFPVKPQSQASAAAPAAEAKEEITFYSALTQPAVAKADQETRKADKETGRQGDKENKRTEKKAEPEKVAKLEVKKAPAKDEEPQKSQTTQSVEQENGNTWTVQVNAVPDERSAKVWVDRLKSKGYNAYVSEVRNKGKTWYRVRVGKYGSREEADKVVDSLKSKENLATVFATSR